MTAHELPADRRDAQHDGVAEYAEATRRRYEAARLIATRRYWRGTKPRVPFVPPMQSPDESR